MDDCIVEDSGSVIARDIPDSDRDRLRRQGFRPYPVKVFRRDSTAQVQFQVWARARPADETFWECAVRVAGSMQGKSLALPNGPT